MAIEIIPNQPIKFERLGIQSVDCNPCDIDFCVPVRPGDFTQFQFKITPCTESTNLFANPGFDESPQVWTSPINTFFNDFFSQGVGYIQVDAATQDSLNQTGIMTVGKYYGLSIDIKVIGADAQIWVDAFGGSLLDSKQIYNSPSSDLTEAILTLEFYGYANSTDFELNYRTTNIESVIVVDNFTIREIDLDYDVAICLEDDTIIKRFNIGDDLTENTESDFVRLTDDRVTVTVDWSADPIPFGCYYVCLFDPCALDDDDFLNLVNWDFGNAYGWTIDDGGKSYIHPGELVILDPGDNMQVTNDFVTELGKDYDFTITVSQDINCLHVMEFLIQGQETVINPTGEVSGTFTGDGTPFYFDVEVTNLDGACEDPPEIRFTSISVGLAGGDQLPDYKSNCFNLQQNNCTLLIEACNDYPAFDLVEEENFVPNVRVEGFLKNPTYSFERSSKIDSQGRQTNSYFSREKFENLVIESQPDYVLDFLSLMAGFNHLYINGDEYVIKQGEEFTPIYNEGQDNLARISILVRKKVEYVKNILCEAEADLGCVPREVTNGIIEEECNLPCIGAPDGSYCIYNPISGALLDQL